MDLTRIVTGDYVNLEAMLNARERRQKIQQRLLQTYRLPLISFTLNIVGPTKVFPLTIRTFDEGLHLIRTQCLAWHFTIRSEEILRENTGHEAFFVVDADAAAIKEILCRLEERISLGRIFDLDVIDTDGLKISRETFQLPPRRCLLCNQEAFLCSRSRTHTVTELLEKECSIMQEYFDLQYASKLSALSMRALLYEVAATPKPGLVDRNNSGSHRDMDFFTFQSSAVSLNRFFEAFTLCGIRNHERSCEEVFRLIRPIGIEAEQVMLEATQGINTHKGMIFSLGVFCSALGYLYGNGIPYSRDELVHTCAAMTRHLPDDFLGITPETAKTHGELLYAAYGIRGIRGEAALGYPTVFALALPIFEAYIERGYSVNDAGILTLLHIIANSEDTNLISRSDYETMKKIQQQLNLLLHSDFYESDYLAAIRKLDAEFIVLNISPGGSADMLALTYFIYYLERTL
ncbi:MAG: triphosphoribosyl-dephospho-CoA synthase CitG [Hungatella sp.]